MSKTYVAAAYDVDLLWGGPEEGGWWYNQGTLVRTLKVFRNEDAGYEYCRRFNERLKSRQFGPNKGKRELSSVLSNGELQVRLFEDSAPGIWPEERPHYC